MCVCVCVCMCVYMNVYVCICVYEYVCMCVCLCNKGPRIFVCQEILTALWQQQLMENTVYYSEDRRTDQCLTAFITFHEI